ncbi:MAG TPA: hypothetical protein VG734_09390 [Lacunisphaera sp.]|nr:hypothetical protein [Lacunisphaera sp.]
MPANPASRVLRSRLAGLALGAALLAGPVRAADEKTVTLPKFAYPEALPALLAAAGKFGVPVDIKQRPAARQAAQAGDTLTFLVSLRDGEKLKQWVLVAETADLTAKEEAMPPLKGFHAYTSTGQEVNLSGRRAAIEMTLIGPVTREEADRGEVKPEVKRRRLLVKADYLSLGFDAGSEAGISLRSEESRKAIAAGFSTKVGSKPFTAEVAQKNQSLAQQIGFTPERERAYWGSVPVLLEFVNIVVKTPGLQDILKEVIDVSWWSILSSGGKPKLHIQVVGRYVQKLNDDGSNRPEQYLFPFVLEVNDKPAMASCLIVTKPTAPLATTGGVIGIQAGRPYADHPQLTIRLIAMACHDPAPSPPTPAAAPPEAKDRGQN